MVRRLGLGLAWAMAVSVGGGCGGGTEEPGDDAVAGTSSSGTGGHATGGSGGQAAGGSGGQAAGTGGVPSQAGTSAGGTSNGGSSAGTAGSTTTSDCTGTFGEPTLILNDGPNKIAGQSLSVTGDDLELFYEVPGPEHGVMVRTRTQRDAAFGDAREIAAAVIDFCPPEEGPSIDISDDGLRLYMTCVNTVTANPDEPFAPAPIYVAERPNRTTLDFVRRPDALGLGGISFSVSADELTAFWSDYSDTSNPTVLTGTRSSLSGSFSAGTEPLGLNQAVLRFPELSTDGLHLFGSLKTGAISSIVMYTRASLSGDFRTPSSEGLPVPPVIADDPNTPSAENVSDFSPTLSADCRSLYFLRYTFNAGVSGGQVWGARR